MVRVRFPPSPTGWLHIGTARVMLFNYLFARHHGGKIIFRSEDTDKERSKPEYENDIMEGLKRLGINWDEGPYRQSERTAIYAKYLKELLAKDAAYYCFCSKERLDKMREEQTIQKKPTRYDGTCSGLDPEESTKRVESGEKAVIRLRVGRDQELKFNDLIRGETVFASQEFDDFVIARNRNDCLYNFTVVIDDHDMQVTHVIRGEDHISNTPKQILIYRAFGWSIPEFAHLPLILNEDKTKMSKRKNKVSLNEYFGEGYLPEALVNFLALLGWNPGEGETKEIFSMEELIKIFSLEHVHKGGAIFDLKKLDWINSEYIKKEIETDTDAFCAKYDQFIGKRLQGDPSLIKKIIQDPDFAGRFKKLNEIETEIQTFFDPLPNYDQHLILNEKFKITPEIAQNVFEKAIETIRELHWELGDSTQSKILSEAMIALVTALNLKNGQVLWPIRAALSGKEKSPNFATLIVYLGKDEVLKRLKFALEKV